MVTAPYCQVFHYTWMLLELNLQLFKRDAATIISVSIFKQHPLHT